tara:strand:- start:157 stop:939 length:783 start_codon:yes stop_codon:yes gene_type:complete
MYPINLAGKTAVVFGVANHRSIAWDIAKILDEAGAEIIFSYQNERVFNSVESLSKTLNQPSTLVECDVSEDSKIENAMKQMVSASKSGNIDIIVHSIAFADKDDLGGPFVDVSQNGFITALTISAYSLISIARYGSKYMANGGSIISMTYQASTRVFPGYNVMGIAKAALENEIKQIAYDLGNLNVRANAISAGPLDTLSSRVISGYRDMKNIHKEKSPLKRNITTEEVSKTALFLSSDLSSGITGEIIHVDTGYNIMGI